MKDNVIIKVENIKKEYRLGAIGGATLRGELQSLAARLRGKEDPNSKIGSKQHAGNERFLALDGISFEVKEGERIGIIGHNGAGKSTFLKVLSRVTAPTSGTISYNGRIASMLEVGTGFHPELTGRENVYMNGAILGMTKAEIDKKFNDIVAFAEMEKFIDTPVKRYSSGMYVKLAFAVAAHLDSEIMIMDEVLAVGDMAFQNKCINKMSSLSKDCGRTILYVSHNMNTIRQLCDRCIVLSRGKVIFNGDVEEAIQIYLKSGGADDQTKLDLTGYKRPENTTGAVNMTTLELVGKENNLYDKNEVFKFAVKWKANRSLQDVRFKIIVRNYLDAPVGVAKTEPIACVKGGEERESLLEFDPRLLAEGRYYISLSIFQQDGSGNDLLLDHITRVTSFQKTNSEADGLVWSHFYWGSVQFDDMKLSDRK